MSETCVKHTFETAVDTCRQCQNVYCSDCLVYAFGDKKPPYCVTCALNVAGVRHQGARPNPRVRKRGWFGRRTVVDEEPVAEPGFDDIRIELPTPAATPEAERTTRREVEPEVLAMVQASEAGIDLTVDDDPIGSTAPVPDDAEDSLAGWAAALKTGEAPARDGSVEAWPESSEVEAWPDDVGGRTY